MSSEEDPVQLVREALYNSLRKRCRDINSYIKITGQREIKISLYALYLSYRSSESYPRLSDALNEAIRRGIDPFKELGFEMIIEDEEEYIKTSSENIQKLCQKIIEER
jgi:hypothetical protein